MGHLDLEPPGEIAAGLRFLTIQQTWDWSGVKNLATMHASPWADIKHMVGAGNGIRVVLDHDDCIAEITQVDQGLDQLVVITLMQADGGFIENIENTRQARTDL